MRRMSAIRWSWLLCLAAPVVVTAALVAWLAGLPQPASRERVIAAYSTSLRGRTRSQVHNLRLALTALDGRRIMPGREFSFNRAVGPWTADRGYRRAPVSYSGELSRDWGGGVCQLATTVYNSALYAGLPIRERHRHHWPTTYAPPGQDAAVAYPGVDLRFANPFDVPLRLSAEVVGEAVTVRLLARRSPPQVRVDRAIIGVTHPLTIVRPLVTGRSRADVRGRPGCQVVVYRTVLAAGRSRREIISRDDYPALNRAVWR